MGFPRGSMVKNLPAVQETREMWVQSLSLEGPLEEEMATHSSILEPGESHGQRSLVCCGPWGLKESDMTEHTCRICRRSSC